MGPFEAAHIAFALGAAALLGVAWLLWKRSRGVRGCFEVAPSLVTEAEARFLAVLSEAAPKNTLVCPKVRAADVVLCTPRGERRGLFPAMAYMHLDFVLIDAATGAPVAAIELDDRSHEEPDRIRRDEFLEDVLAEAGLPLIRVTVQRGYSATDLRRELEAVI